jgi:hypothetical protein
MHRFRFHVWASCATERGRSPPGDRRPRQRRAGFELHSKVTGSTTPGPVRRGHLELHEDVTRDIVYFAPTTPQSYPKRPPRPGGLFHAGDRRAVDAAVASAPAGDTGSTYWPVSPQGQSTTGRAWIACQACPTAVAQTLSNFTQG